jgi:hypothetical protein
MVPGGKSLKYGVVLTARGSIVTDEPVFLIRSQDRCAIEALIAYHRVALKCGASQEFLADVETAIRAFEDWKGCRKIPD